MEDFKIKSPQPFNSELKKPQINSFKPEEQKSDFRVPKFEGEEKKIIIPENKSGKIKMTVYDIVKGNLYLKGDNGQEYKIHSSEKYKNAKIGDIFYK